MIRFRPFRNTDPPALCEVWRSQPPRRGLTSSLTPILLDRYVYSKPYFDRFGLIVAEDDERIIGFAHVGFGAEITDGGQPQQGVVSMLMTLPTHESNDLAGELLKYAEDYMRSRGAVESTAIGNAEHCPYYLGFYGGSGLPGVLQSDMLLHDAFTAHGYERRGECVVWQRQIATYHPPIDRKLMQVRRQCAVEPQIDPPPKNWWDACMFACHDLTRFSIRQRTNGVSVGDAIFWEMEPLASSWGVHATGMVKIEVHPDYRRLGYATFLLGEALRQLQAQGITMVEIQADAENDAASGLFRKLGFEPADRGSILTKSLIP
jgi:ribosomal protein S18 acetylase RimI-like enzyme